MRQGPNSRRTRSRNNNTGRRTNLPNRNQTFDSNGPEVRIRGNAYQVHEKYLTLARDASAAGDRVMSENYLQHAEHYYRIINAMNEAYAQADRQPYDGQRASGRETGQREFAARENGRADSESREAREVSENPDRELEFGEDPRGIDDSEPVSLDRTAAAEPDINNAAAARDGAAEDPEAGEWSRPIRPRRRPPRPRRPAGGNGSTEATESPTEGGGD